MGAVDLIFVGLLLALLLPMTLIDLQQQRIPNVLNLCVGLLGLLHGVLAQPALATAGWALLQGVLAFALFASTARIMQMVNRRAYVGWGDLKFLVAVSFWVGVGGSVAVLVVACLFHIAVVLVMIPWRGLDRDRLRPFGPMLAAGMLTVVVAAFLQRGPA